MGRPNGSKNKTFHKWTNEEKEYLIEITPGNRYIEIQKIMSEKFNYDFTLKQIEGAIKRYKLSTGLTGQFQKGHIPVNKGVKGVIYEGTKKTWFQKGQAPINYRPVGSERLNVDGYIEIKVADPKKWRLKHNVIWEEHNRPIPEGYAVLFGDGDKSNFDINNLILVSRQQLLMLNRHNLIQNDADLTRTGIVIADLYQKMSERKNKAK